LARGGGETLEEALREITKDAGAAPLNVEIVDLEHTEELTLEYQAERVQIFIDKDGRVPYAPQLG
jgi:hypothetical protein